MTKQEVIEGALTLNDNYKKYTVTTDGDKIIIEAKYHDIPSRESTFRCVARLKDNNTYTETTCDLAGSGVRYGVRKKAVLYTLNGTKETFDSKDVSKVLRDYLDACGYKRAANKRLIAQCLCIPLLVMALVLTVFAVTQCSDADFVDTNGPENFALTEITREDIVGEYEKFTVLTTSQTHSGKHTNISEAKLQKYDYDSISMAFEKIHGVVPLHASKVSDNTLTLKVNSSVEAGNAEIVILIEGEYYCSVEVNQNKSITLHNISDKEIVVKLAGEGAKMKVTVTRIY